MTSNSTDARPKRGGVPTGKGAHGRSAPGPAPAREVLARSAPDHRLLRAPYRVRHQSSGARLELSEGQLRAAELILRGFHLRTDGLGMRTQSWGGPPRGRGASEDWQQALMRRFLHWAVAAQGEGLSVAAALDFIVFGKSCRAIDRERRRRSGYARRNLLDSLELYQRV